MRKCVIDDDRVLTIIVHYYSVVIYCTCIMLSMLLSLLQRLVKKGSTRVPLPSTVTCGEFVKKKYSFHPNTRSAMWNS